jgi:hypothetical protein
MNVKGKIKSVGSTEQKSAKFSVRTFVLELEGKYPELVEFQLINDNTLLINPFSAGDEIEVDFNLKGREYNGRVYNSLQVWKISGELKTKNESTPKTENPQGESEESKDDLPF